MKRVFVSLMVGLFLFAVGGYGQDLEHRSEMRRRALAERLAHRYIIVDGHVDLPYRLKVRNFRLEREYLGIPVQTDEGDFDYVRAKQGGLDAPFMSIYLPSRLQEEPGASKRLADSLIRMVEGIVQAHPDKFALAYSPAQLRRNFKKGLVSLPMGMENGSGIEDDLANVAYFHRRGIRYITLTHAKDNLICDSSYDTTRTWNGLSPFGRKVVREMNRVGIMVDISHVSDSTFWQVMELTEAPCIASHSSCRAFTPGFERNMNDDMIRALARNGGLIMINFGSTFLDGAVARRRDQMRAELGRQLDSLGLDWRSEEAQPYIQAYVDAHRDELFADVARVADHIDHVVQLVGVEHVGLGSDFDGVGDSLPVGLKDVSAYPNLIYELLRRGYSRRDIKKICGENLLRVWKQVERVARKR